MAIAVAMRGLAEGTEQVKGRKVDNYDIEEDIEEKIHELESVKEMEKALLDKLNNKLSIISRYIEASYCFGIYNSI